MENIIETADEWMERVNAKDVAGLLAVSDHNIEMIGPAGSGVGHDTLKQWVMENSHIHLATQNRYAKGDKVVYEQVGTWDDERGKVTIYTYMEIKHNKVCEIARYDTLDDAFGSSGLNEEDKI
ncbi:MAG TPA: nuclear transport factor 2 family protein [Planococcus sp. (in: firmicutes)]|nr:nuclear transport factor 2 family protein [Planococcus sp. (in: firmicutes)]